MKTIEVLQPEAVINIVIGGEFYRRLQNLSTYLSGSVNPDILVQELTKMTEHLPLSEFGTHFETMLILIKEIETKARAQGLITTAEIPDTEEQIS